jgi:hypothetical protein
MATVIPRETIIGRRLDGKPESETEHFTICPSCGERFDMRDLGAVLDHERRCRNRKPNRLFRALLNWLAGKIA